MSDTWTDLPFLGLVPHFHADPADGGAPLASADGHWWWDGHSWTPAAETTVRNVWTSVVPSPSITYEDSYLPTLPR